MIGREVHCSVIFSEIRSSALVRPGLSESTLFVLWGRCVSIIGVMLAS